MTQGPVYDNALRQLAADELVSLCRWLGVDADIGSVRLSEALPATTQYADLLVGVGAGRLAQVEFVRQPTPDLPHRMLEYRARIMRFEPEAALTQHVVVLAGGQVPEVVRHGEELVFRLHVTYLREQDPQTLLESWALAPLAVLGRARAPSERAVLLRGALETIHHRAPPERAATLAAVASTLAGIYLDVATIEEAGREARMPITLEGTVAGRELEARFLARGEARGALQGRLAVLQALLTRRFGDDPRTPALSARLAELGDDEAVAAVLAAERLEDLLTEG